MTRRTIILAIGPAFVLAALFFAATAVAGCNSTTTVNSPLDVVVNNPPATVVVTSK